MRPDATRWPKLYKQPCKCQLWRQARSLPEAALQPRAAKDARSREQESLPCQHTAAQASGKRLKRRKTSRIRRVTSILPTPPQAAQSELLVRERVGRQESKEQQVLKAWSGMQWQMRAQGSTYFMMRRFSMRCRMRLLQILRLGPMP